MLIPQPSAFALLDAYLDLLRLNPSPATWSALSYSSDPVQNGYYRRVVALTQAVEVPLTLLTEPEFTAERLFTARPDGWDKALRQEIEAALAVPGEEEIAYYDRGVRPMPDDYRTRHQQAVNAWFLRDLSIIFAQYLTFLGQLKAFQRVNDGWMMASSAGARFSIQTTDAVVASMDQVAINRIRQFLARLIDPAGRCYTQAELVARFGYPIDDMNKIEADSW